MKVKTTKRTALVLSMQRCQPGNPLLPVGPECPDPVGTRVAVSAALKKSVSRISVKDLVSLLRVKSPADLLLEYARPAGSTKLTGVAINVVQGNTIVDQFVGDAASLSRVKEGEAIEFTLGDAFKKYGKKLLDYSIVIAIAFEAGAPVADPGEIIALRPR